MAGFGYECIDYGNYPVLDAQALQTLGVARRIYTTTLARVFFIGSMSCENCFKGSLLPGEPQGSFVDGAYFHAAAAPAVEGEPKRAVVLLSDIFGLPLKNCKILADIISERVGVDVWVPDLFDGASRVEYGYRFMLTAGTR